MHYPKKAYFQHTADLVSCDDLPDRCNTCPLYKTRCVGCVESGKRDPDNPEFCNQGECYTQCLSCIQAKGVASPSISPKSPWLSLIWPDRASWGDACALNDLEDYDHTVAPLSFSHKGINQNQGSAGSVRQDPYPPETEVVAVSIRHVWTQKGFNNADLKTHLRLNERAKLLVLTMTKDDLLEDYARADLHGQTFESVGIDFWMPLMFSNYRQMGNTALMFNGLRAYRSLKLGKGHFLPMVFSQAQLVEDLVLNASLYVKNAIFNFQFVESTNVSAKLKSVLHWHHILDESIPFFFVGPSRLDVITILRSFLSPRPCYFVSVNPWMNAFRGKGYDKEGKTVLDYATKREDLVHENQRNFFHVCGMPLRTKDTQTKQAILDATRQKAILRLTRYEAHPVKAVKDAVLTRLHILTKGERP